MSDFPKITLNNTLSAKKEAFQPRTPGVGSLYGCGPTVYGFTHVGNARTTLLFDLVTRVFELAGYRTQLARNITDIDDKIIRLAAERSIPWNQVAQEFTDSFHAELLALETRKPAFEPKATDAIPAMISIIEGLIKKGMAYPAETPFGTDVYFSVRKFPGYGKLSKRKLEDLEAGARVDVGEMKIDPLDFALWKAAKEGEPSWTSPWGEGRPGWHIECSAMIRQIFPTGIDVHMGAIDLIFPHHENEIAQSEGFCGGCLSTYWVHGGFLTMSREKMSKSVGNIFTTQKFLEMYGPEVLRLMCLQHHYGSPMDFSVESIHLAEALLERLYSCKKQFSKIGGPSSPTTANFPGATQVPAEITGLAQSMKEALFDDFNSAKALGFALRAARICFREDKAEFWAAFGESFEVFNRGMGLLGHEASQALADIRKRKLSRYGVTEARCSQIEERLAARELARKNKDFAESDRLRAALEAEGVLVMDGPDGTNWGMKSL